MRWPLVVLAAYLVVVGSQRAAAQTTSPILSGEVTVETLGEGVSILPADKAIVTLNLRRSGATNKEARATVRSFADQLRRELIALGVPEQSIDLEDPTNRLGFVGSEQASAMLESMSQASPAAKPPVSATASLQLTITDLRLLPRLREYIDRKDAVVMENPAFSLADDRRARDLAIADGMRKAQLDAEAYAGALGMRVSRVISAKDQATQNVFSFPDYDRMIERFTGRSETKTGMVRTSVQVAAKFGLVPR